MLAEKLFAETLDVADPNEFASDPDRFVESALRSLYVGRCRMGAYVVRILKVTRRSSCRLKDTDLSAEGYVDVEFLAEVSVLGQWDIVTGVVVRREGALIFGKTEVEATTIVALRASPAAEALRDGQTVSVRVLAALYNASQNSVTASGLLLTCDTAAPVYLVAGRLSAADAREIAPLANRVRRLLAARAALAGRAADVAFFEELLYSYPRVGAAGSAAEPAGSIVESADAAAWAGPAAHPLPDGAEAVNLLDLVDEAAESDEGGVEVGGVWSRDLALYRSSPLAALAKSRPGRWKEPIGKTPRIAIASMLKTVHDFLKAVNEMLSVYPTREAIDEHQNIWLMMRRVQLPAP